MKQKWFHVTINKPAKYNKFEEKFINWYIVRLWQSLRRGNLSQKLFACIFTLNQKYHRFDDFFSLTVHEAVILTTSGAINGENFVQKRQHFRFSVSYHSNGIRRLKSSATGMFVGQLGYVIGKENTQAPHCWTCVRGIHWCRWVGLPSQRSSNAGVFMPCRRRYPVDTRRNNNISITLKRRRNVDLTT